MWNDKMKFLFFSFNRSWKLRINLSNEFNSVLVNSSNVLNSLLFVSLISSLILAMKWGLGVSISNTYFILFLSKDLINNENENKNLK